MGFTYKCESALISWNLISLLSSILYNEILSVSVLIELFKTLLNTLLLLPFCVDEDTGHTEFNLVFTVLKHNVMRAMTNCFVEMYV